LGLDAYWRAANYLSVGQIYLLDNPLLREPLAPEPEAMHQAIAATPRGPSHVLDPLPSTSGG
jgi:phosphoketolase